VCGGRAIVVKGVPFSVCKVHREYYAERGRKASKAAK
jgi:hypothetical protein